MSIDIEEIRRRTNHAARGWPEDRVLTRLSVDVLDLCDALDTARAEIARLTEQAGNRRQRNVELVNANTALAARTETAEAQIAAMRALISDRACHIYGGTPDASDDGVPLGMLIVALDARP